MRALLAILPLFFPPQTSTTDAVRGFLEARQATSGFPGVSAAWVDREGRAHAVAVGLADVEGKVAMTPNYRLLAGSTGKTYFAATALMLFQEKGVRLDDKLSKWFANDAWFKALPHAEAMTIRHLMNHSSGIHDHVRNPQLSADLMAKPDRVWKNEELLAYIPKEAPPFDPGKGFEYADTNYIIVAMLIEKLGGKPAYDTIRERILRPNGLERTIPSDQRTLADLACGYSTPHPPFTVKGRMIADDKLAFNPQMEGGGGGFASNPTELARWAWLLYGGKVLPADTLKTMLQGIPANTGPNEKYGLAVQIRQSAHGISYGHSGWFPGYLTDMAFYPDLGIAVAIQFNTDNFRQVGMNPKRMLDEIARLASTNLPH